MSDSSSTSNILSAPPWTPPRGAGLAACEVARGKYMRTVVPNPDSDSIWTSPLDCWTNPQTIESPRPLPFPEPLVVKNGSQARAVISGDMPFPESDTLMQTY